MRGSNGNVGVIPKEIADNLRGKSFNNFDEFREAFWQEPEEYTWHHLDDYNPETNKTTMQLVDSNAHDATKPHKGSAGQYDDINGPSYNPPKKKLTK